MILILCLFGGIAFAIGRFTEEETIESSEVTVEQLRAMASKTRAEDIVIYTMNGCPYAAQAKAWLKSYGFDFIDCNISSDKHCEAEFRAYDATGTPYLIVHGHHMKDGFDSEEFIEALAR
jgi:glutaredoxin